MLNIVDISNWQGNAGFNPNAVSTDGYIVKVTEGTGYTDPYYKTFADKTLASGRVLGLYHFATGYNWQAEADYFLSRASAYIGKAVLILDFEGGAVTAGGVNFATKWLDYVKSKTGVTPMFYTYLNVENSLNWSDLAKRYPLWLAQYNNYNAVYGFQPRELYGSLKYWSKMTCFQYTSSGRLSGYSGNLDLNAFYGAKNDWQALVGKNEEDEEVAWHPEVKYNVLGMFKVNRQGGAKLYTSSELTNITQENGQDAIRKYGDFIVWEAKGGAVRAGTQTQWFSQADGLTKINPLAFNDNARAICKITTDDAYTQNEATAGAGGITHLPKGSTWQVFGRVDKYLIVGGEKDGKYVNADKAVIVL